MNKHEQKLNRLLDTFGQDLIEEYTEMVVEYAPKLLPKYWILADIKENRNDILKEINLLDLVGCNGLTVFWILHDNAKMALRRILEDRMLENVRYD